MFHVGAAVRKQKAPLVAGLKERNVIVEPKWMKRPTSLNAIPDDTEIIISIDETGTSNLKPVQKAINRRLEPDESERTFTITACALNIEDYMNSLSSVYDLKCKITT